MDDHQALANIISEIKTIEENNEDNMQHINSIDMLLVSNDNATLEDEILSERFSDLSDKVADLVNATEEFITLVRDEYAE